MITETITRIKLIASSGMILTNGKAFGNAVYVAYNAVEDWREVPVEEYQKHLAELEAEVA